VQELLAHVAWVRRLATQLVAGAADADDVAQETWRRALERPPQHAHQLRHWLALAARNVARQLQRAARTREKHESSVMPAPLEPSSDDLVARAQMQRRVVDAVLALDANYREVVLARFFDDQKPSHIAARLGLPVETVKTRLKRGLERVRGQLVADRPDAPSRRELARALAPLLAMRALELPTRVMTVWKCAAAIVAAAALALVVRHVSGWSAPSDVRAAESAAASFGTEEPGAPPPLAAERVPVGATAEEVAAPTCALLRGFVVDASGGIVPQATITWRVGESVSQVAIDEGEYAIAGLAGGDVSFNVEAKGFQPRNVTLALCEMAETRRHDFVLAPSIVLPVRIVASDAALQALPTFHMAIAVTDRPLPAALPATSGSYYPASYACGRAYLVGGGRAPAGYAPSIAPGTDGVLEAAHLPIEATLLLRDVILARRHVDASDAAVVFTLDPDVIERTCGGFTCTCVDAESGAPLGGAGFECETSSEGGRHIEAADDGKLEMRPLLPGWFEVTWSAVGHERRSESLLLRPGETKDLGTIALDRERKLTGTLTDLRGRPAQAEFSVQRLDRYVRGRPFFSHRYFGSETIGRLEIGGLGRGRYVLQGPAPSAGDPDEGAALIVVDLTSGRTPPPLDVRLVPETFVHVAPRHAPGEVLFAELRTAAGDLVHADHVMEGSFFVRLPLGDYTVALFEMRADLPKDGPPLRTIPFRASGPRIKVEFDVRDDSPAILSRPDPILARLGRSIPVSTIPEAPTARIRKELSRVVVGTVLDRDGAAIVDAAIAVADSSGRARRTTSGTRGDFALAGVGSGPVRVTVAANGFIDADPIEIPGSEPPAVMHVVLESATRVRIRITDLGGSPLKARPRLGFHVVATRDAPGERWKDPERPIAAWDESEFDRGFAGRLEIKAPLPVFVNLLSEGVVVATTQLTTPVEELTLAVDPSRLPRDDR